MWLNWTFAGLELFADIFRTAFFIGREEQGLIVRGEGGREDEDDGEEDSVLVGDEI